MTTPSDPLSRVRAVMSPAPGGDAPSRRRRDEDDLDAAPPADPDAPARDGAPPPPATPAEPTEPPASDAGAPVKADADGADASRADRSSALLASGLGLLGVGGAASVAVAAAGGSSSKPPVAEVERPKPETPKPERPEQEQPGPEQPKPEAPGPEQPKPEGPKPEKPESESPKPEQPKPEQPKPEQPKPEEPQPERPKPEEPKPEEPKPEQPKPEEPKPEQPKPEEPKPEQPKPEQPGGTDPEPTPDVPAPRPRLVMDTGVSDRDGITSRADVQVDALLGSGRWRYSLDGGESWVAGSGDRIAAAAFGADGRKDLIVEQFDAQGHRSVSSRLSFELDTLAPAALTPTAPANGWLGRDGDIHVGKLDRDAHWQYSLDGTTWRAGTGGGLRGAEVGKEGEQQVWLRQVDLAGNTSEASRITVNVDLTAPTDAAIRLHVDPAIDGPFTTQPHMTHGPITVAADAGWAYSWDGQSWRTDAEYGAVVRTQGLIDGFHTLYVRQQDQAGNVTINERSFTLDNVRPAAPTLRLVNDTGWSNVDKITSDGTLRVTNLEPNAKWWLKTVVNGKDYYQGGSGDTITTADLGLPAGEVGKVSVFLWQVDQATNQSAMTRFDFELYAQTAVI
ncbi:hypothetical protein FHT39_004760 [Mitsuaria sp. BK045]|uniref:hypothetical protein n=1 Tax=unclassified Roseateles TaxID=2626991 RepID=UPI0016099539|nr:MULTISPECIES: hypothetical protein [unclassified Roseateles]MBB3296081.1 hypothetical protein [Mitsuaria sp. BK041]MBB3365296.1 hypothetical protein [Mitsuaria sp. BK045]